MFKFLNRWKEAELTEAERNKALYVDLVGKAAKAGDLNDADAAKLKTAADKLGYTAEKIAKDIEVLETVRALEPEAAALEARRIESKRLGKEVNDYDKERDRMKAEIDRKFNAMSEARTIAQNLVMAAGQAVDKLADLKRANPDLFPVVAAQPSTGARPEAVTV